MISDTAGPSPHPRANYVNMAGLGMFCHFAELFNLED